MTTHAARQPSPSIRTDLVDLYLFRIEDANDPRASAAFLQLQRRPSRQRAAESSPASDADADAHARTHADAEFESLAGTWQPVMGRIEPGVDESAVDAAVRETREETGLDIPREARGFWQLEQVRPFYLARSNEIVMSPRFAVEVPPGWTPTLNEEHTSHRWVALASVESAFVWPGQQAAIAEIATHILPPDAPARRHLDLLRRA